MRGCVWRLGSTAPCTLGRRHCSCRVMSRTPWRCSTRSRQRSTGEPTPRQTGRLGWPPHIRLIRMDADVWRAVDDYFSDRLVQSDEVLRAALTASADAGLPSIQVTPPQGKQLMLFARMLGARSI